MALALALIVLGSWELFLRGRGHRPGLNDEDIYWVAERLDVGRDRHALVLLGDSRVQMGLHLETLRLEMGPARPVQLALTGSTPVPVLEDLAADPEFVGVAVMGLNPVLHHRDERLIWETARDAVALSRSAAAHLPIEARLTMAVQRRVAFRRPELSPDWLLRYRTWPPAERVEARPDRSRHATARLLETRKNLLPRAGPMLDADQREALQVRVAHAARAVKARGGAVVLLRMPSSGAVRELERRRVPRAQAWDELVRRSGVPAIHFEDHASLRTFECPDGSHLDRTTSPSFTRALVPILKAALAATGDTRFAPLREGVSPPLGP